MKIFLAALSLLVTTAAAAVNDNNNKEHPHLRQNVPTGTLWRPRSIVQESLASLKENKLVPEKKTPIDVRLLPAADLDAMYQNDMMLRHRKLPPDNTPPLCVDIPGDGPRGLCIAYFKQGCFTAPDRTSCEKIVKNYEKATGGESLPTCISDLTALQSAVAVGGPHFICPDTTIGVSSQLDVSGTGTVELTCGGVAGSCILDGGWDGTPGNINGNRIFFNQGTLTLTDLTLQHGSATGGGAILNVGTLNLIDCTLKENSAGFYGGAVFTTGDLNVVGGDFSDNTAGYGGAIYSGGGQTNLDGAVKFDQNVAKFGGDDGDHIYVQSGSLTCTALAPPTLTNPTNSGVCVFSPGAIDSNCGNPSCP